MEKECSKNGTEFMTVSTMTWQCRKRVQIIIVQFSEGRCIFPILEEEEQVGNHTNKLDEVFGFGCLCFENSVSASCDKTVNEFDSFQDVLDLYEGGIKLPSDATIKKIRDCLPWEMIRELVRNDGERLMKFPIPAVIKAMSDWRSDEEFARETLAGVNPIIIIWLEEFPSTSKLDPKEYGNQKSTITREHIESNMDGLTVEEDKFYRHENGVEGSIWQLATAYAAMNDSGFHQLVSHCHAVIEPFIIATHRQLSVVHPIYKLLHPHFRDTMNINALACQSLINADGVLELTVFPAMAVPDSSCPHGLKLMIKDYPYCLHRRRFRNLVRNRNMDDREIKNEGHGDLKNQPWWPVMNTRTDLIQTCTIIIWIAPAFHAAVNFGQYPYAGYLPNRPTVSRRFMPEQGSDEYEELKIDPDLVFLKTITSQFQTVLGISLIEVLSRHSTDEIYLGQRDTEEWTTDEEPLGAFERFGKELMEIERRIMERNNDGELKNRIGSVTMPYMLMYPNTSDYSREGGLTGKGIPNSISI
ncbi:Linoleate 9S-lipoxygenase A [Hibiscus syriacus]|uniref:Lipoxygenase n=1 Tax=Hibiscus syriacus TaxID=106335 RepID=A0A6A3CL84_HIBSY|nr:Linoleate 9S-lipoxygenase A [Hibiscus syriacus]